MTASRSVLLIAVAVILSGCGAAPRLDDRALGTFFEEEGLERIIRMDAAVTEIGDGLGVRMRAAVPAGELVFHEREEEYEAIVEIRFSLLDAGGDLISTQTLRDTVRVASLGETRELPPATLEVELPVVEAGEYVGEIQLLDASEDVVAHRRMIVRVEDPVDGPILSSPLLFLGEEPLVGDRLAAWSFEPAARVETEVIGTDSNPIHYLLRHPSDHSVADPPHWTSPGRDSPAYLGVRFDRPPEDSIPIPQLPDGWLLPPLDPGAYRLLAEIESTGLRSERFLFILPPNHPHITTLDGRIDALAYLAYPSELEHIRSGSTHGERQRRYDALWESLYEDRGVAETVMHLYYERVEAANQRFSSHKPGWMTDRGMMLIVGGQPEAIERTPETETWHYDFGRPDLARTYIFDRVPYPAATEGGHHYVLRRAARYEEAWQEAVSNLRTGVVPDGP